MSAAPRLSIRWITPAFLLSLSLLAQPLFPQDCEALRQQLTTPHTSVSAAQSVTAGSFQPPGSTATPPLADLPAFCRIALTLTPSTDSEIHVEIWLPTAAAWNGRFVGTGNGGFAGKIAFGSLAAALKRGYAAANTDLGLAIPPGSDASIFTGRPERWADWGYRATHEMTLAAKRVILAYYGHSPRRSYFEGCSTGGEQALMEAQRFPDDYDGIVAGAPAHNRTGVHTSILWNFVSQEREAAAFLAAPQLALLAKAAMAACDAQDGLQDGILSNPAHCQFDPRVLQCTSSSTADALDKCLTAAQVETARRLYRGPGPTIYPGLPPGTERSWTRLAPGSVVPKPVPYGPIFQWVFGRDWDWHRFDFNRDYPRFQTTLASRLNATSADLREFRQRGHKLLMYHGWADWLVVPGESIAYYETAVQKNGSNPGDFLRLFMVPGMEHCSGGPGPSRFDALAPLVDWVEHGTAPVQIIATKYRNDQTADSIALQRPLCPYPQQAHYRGPGHNPADAASFECTDPSHAP